MPKQPSAPAGVPIFARLHRFDVECPACLCLMLAGFGGRASDLRVSHQRTRGIYNPLLARLTCPSCRATFGVGLLLWRIKPSHPSRRRQRPADQVPSPAQRAAIRTARLSLLAADRQRQGDPLNVFVEDACTCPEGLDGRIGWARHCPVHGSDAFNARLASQDDDLPPDDDPA